MTTCPMCAEDVSAQDAICPHCGSLTGLADNVRRSRRRRILALAIAVGLLGAAAVTIVIVTGRSSPTPTPESAVIARRDTGSSESKDPNTGQTSGTRRDFSTEGLPLSILVPEGATTSTRATGKGPTIHGHVEWPSASVTENGRQFLDAPTVDVVDWDGPCHDGNAPAGALVERNDRTVDGLAFSYRDASGMHSGEVCNTRVGYRCTFGSVTSAIAPKALAACMSVERGGSKPQPPSTPTAPEPITGPEVHQLLNAQAAALTSNRFADSFADSAVAFFPHALEPAEGRAAIAEAARKSWQHLGPQAQVETPTAVVGLYGSIAWGTTTWTVNRMPIRVSEVLVKDATGLRVIAASFSVAPSRGTTGINTHVPSFVSGRPVTPGPETWLAAPLELAKHLHNDPSTSLFGSDATEVAVGRDAVHRVLTAWKNVRLEIVGNVSVIEEEGFQVVAAYARWRTSKPVVFRVLALFVPGEGYPGSQPWEAASMHYSVTVRPL